MFGKNSKDQLNNESIVGETVFINGNFECEEDVIVFGKIDGFIKTNSNIYIKSTSIINADIKAKNVFIEGIVNGNIDCEEFVEVLSSAKLVGDVSTSVINIEKGAFFNGKCSIKETKEVNVVSGISSEKNIDLDIEKNDKKNEIDFSEVDSQEKDISKTKAKSKRVK